MSEQTRNCDDCKKEVPFGDEVCDCETCNQMLCEECAEEHFKNGHLVTIRIGRRYPEEDEEASEEVQINEDDFHDIRRGVG